MWHHVFLLFRRQAGKSALACSGFLLAACALILLSATTQTTVAVGNQIISQSWRSSYDLVVLPPQAHLTTKSIIPADLLAGYDGGISLQQYQQIKNLSGVKVAAPIAYLGYVQMPVPHVLFSQQALAPGYYRLDWTLTAFNGQHDIVERKETTYYYVPSNCTNLPSSDLQDALSRQGVALNCTSPSVPWSEFSTVDTGTFLLAAIDPTAENQLVRLDKSVSSGRMLSSQDGIQLDTDPNLGNALVCPKGQIPGSSPGSSHCKKVPNYDIPVLFHTQVPGQITLRGRFARVASATLDPRTVLAQGGAAYLAHLSPLQTLFDGLVPLVQNDPQRFSTREILWDGHSWQPFVPIFGKAPYYYNVNFLYTPSGLTYQPTKPSPGQSGSAYVVLPNGVQKPEVAFRQLHPLHIAQGANPFAPQAYYFFNFVGHFAGDTLAAQFSNPLNWLPENTYISPPAILRYDAQGKLVNPTNMLPTTNPAGFTLQPPLALTTLSVAARLRGNTPISAIRIRVSGVDAANPASWKRIQQVAELIEQRTHLRALVTLGSSPRPTLVYVPGVQQGQFGAQQRIAPLGWIEERWIAVGVSILYLAQLGVTRLLLIGTVLAVCLGYLAVSFSSLVTAQRSEFAILSALGWRPWQPVRLFLTQALLLALIGGALGVGIALLISAFLSATPIWLLVIWTLPTMLVMALVSSLYPLWLIWRIRPSEILRAGAALAPARVKLWGIPLWSFVSPTWAMVVRNLTRSRPRTLLTIVSLFLSTILLVLMFSGVLALRQSLTGTLLGDFVLLQTAAPQIAGCIFAVLLSFLSVTDLLLLQVRERQREMGLLEALGWHTGLVQRMLVQEGIVLAFIGALPGVLVAEWILMLQHTDQQLISPLLIAAGAVIFMLVVAALAALPALETINRMQVHDILRAE
ncbi:MAG TPA: FtsX-like permease family protein [Ktedonobacteraceae bacterium]|nr:FtsX-like permease family protein [Ktedonobacteraceae bacterium]